MRKKVIVTQKDFERSLKLITNHFAKLSRSCPNALAIQRIFKGEFVQVGPNYILIGTFPSRRQINLPPEGRAIIDEFSLYERNEPLSIKLPITYNIEF